MSVLVKQLAEELEIEEGYVRNAVALLFDEKCTIPFVTRYRKEKTGSMTEVTLMALRDRYTYVQELAASKERYLKVIEEHAKEKSEIRDKLPQLREKIAQCRTKQELEDIYLPFKPKRKTRAMTARERGLDVLLEAILEQWANISDLRALARPFIKTDVAANLQVADEDEALSGASDIFAERINETAEFRNLARRISNSTGFLVANVSDRLPTEGDAAKNASKYENYFSYREAIDKAPSHRVMAVRRGEAEKVLNVYIEVDEEAIKSDLYQFIKNEKQASELPMELDEWLRKVIQDAYKRLIAPAIETELRMDLKVRAENDAIRVFATNLRNLLLLPPTPQHVVCGVDPGLRTGSKIAIVSETGALLESAVLFPKFHTEDSPQNLQVEQTLRDLLEKHKVTCIALGNGTGSREIDRLILNVLRKHGMEHIKRYVVNESGASVYSTDEIAREEFPDLDPTIRSAISIARRLQDPLAELVKIDPRSLGVGQYQHDCDVTKLDRSLQETVESCVNNIGVNVNTASFKLLSYVSGIGPSLAKNIVSHRDKAGAFHSRQALREVSGFGPKTFEQAAGFLRIPSAENPLDNSAVHPESYEIVEKIAGDLQVAVKELVGKDDVVKTITLEKYVDEAVGMPTLLDIVKELVKPGRDPRQDNERLESSSLTSINDLTVGMHLKGTISNVTKFGCFVDVGVHQDGLVHISELPKPGMDPSSAFAVGEIIEVYVKAVDLQRSRISLTCRKESSLARDSAPAAAPLQQRERGPTIAPKQARQASPSSQESVIKPADPQIQVQSSHQAQPLSPIQPGQGRRPTANINAKNIGFNKQDLHRPQVGKPKNSPIKKAEEKSFSVADLLSKFNSRP